jgi:hypothetical protein
MSSPHRHCTSSEIPATVGDTISLPRGGTIREIFSLFSAYCIVKWFLSSLHCFWYFWSPLIWLTSEKHHIPLVQWNPFFVSLLVLQDPHFIVGCDFLFNFIILASPLNHVIKSFYFKPPRAALLNPCLFLETISFQGLDLIFPSRLKSPNFWFTLLH